MVLIICYYSKYDTGAILAQRSEATIKLAAQVTTNSFRA